MNDSTEIDPLWHLADTLTLRQAAALIAGYEPAAVEQMPDTTRPSQEFPRQYPVESSLRNAVLSGEIKAEQVTNGASMYIRCTGDPPAESWWQPIDKISVVATRVKVHDVLAWLVGQNFRTGFFFPHATDAPDYLDRNNPRYAPKLAAAVRAWQAVTNPNGKRPKQALMKWLREHAAEYGLSDDEGKPNDTGIEEVAKVANWQPGGGAPKTPGE